MTDHIDGMRAYHLCFPRGRVACTNRPRERERQGWILNGGVSAAPIFRVYTPCARVARVLLRAPARTYMYTHTRRVFRARSWTRYTQNRLFAFRSGTVTLPIRGCTRASQLHVLYTHAIRERLDFSRRSRDLFGFLRSRGTAQRPLLHDQSKHVSRFFLAPTYSRNIIFEIGRTIFIERDENPRRYENVTWNYVGREHMNLRPESR